MVAEAAEKYQLDVNPDSLIRDLSVGYKQKVELLKALIRGAKVLILSGVIKDEAKTIGQYEGNPVFRLRP